MGRDSAGNKPCKAKTPPFVLVIIAVVVLALFAALLVLAVLWFDSPDEPGTVPTLPQNNLAPMPARTGGPQRPMAKKEAVCLFDCIKTEAYTAIEREAMATVQRYQKSYGELQSKMSQNEKKFANEKKKVLKKLLSMTTNMKFDDAKDYLHARAKKDEELREYPVSQRVSVLATAKGRENFMKKATPFLRQQLLKFAKVPEIGGTMTFQKLEEHFKTNARSNVESVQTKLRAMEPTEKEFFDKRSNWFNGHKSALSKAIKYYLLVANTGKKYQSNKNIGNILRHYGWQPRKLQGKPDDRVWIDRITKDTLYVQIRRYGNDGRPVCVGLEKIPLWEAHNFRIFDCVFALYPRVKAEFSNFDECKSCFEFYVRPSMYEAKVVGAAYFLQNDLKNAQALWNPDWGQTYIDTTIMAIMRESLDNKRRLKKHLEKILNGTPVLKENTDRINVLLPVQQD